MAKIATVRRRPRGTIIGATAAVTVVALLATLAITAQGYDAQEAPRLETSVWVTRADGQYARVNTDLDEIDTVRSAEDPSGVIQLGANAYVLTQNNRLLWSVDPANPRDLSTSATAAGAASAAGSSSPSASSDNTPQGTRSIATAGKYVAYLTETNKVFLGVIPNSEASADTNPSAVAAVDPYAEQAKTDEKNAPVYSASAVAVSATGQLALYSADEHAIRRFDATTGKFAGNPVVIPSPPAATDAVDLALIGNAWVLSDPTASKVWIEGKSPISTGLAAGALLQSSSPQALKAYLADRNGLLSVDLKSGATAKVASSSGEPAQPVVVDGVTYAAWLSANSGSLWSSTSKKSIPLTVASGALDDVQAIAPVFRTNGMRAVLSEATSGLLWAVPDGTAIPLDEWRLDDGKLDAGTVKVDDVAEEEPPVAVADSFGVRRGALVRLPLLLNDHDPNKKDVLSIDPASMTALNNPAFGDVGLISNNQEAVVRVRTDSGSANFTYSVTDGAQKSAPVTVTLTVVPDAQNSAPVWCGVESCRQVWPTPQLAAGGTIVVPVLTGWVDPEGDPLVLTDARKDNTDDPVTVVPEADGSVAIRHLDPNAGGTTIPITISVSDSQGLVSVKTLQVTVAASPSLVVAPVAIAAAAGEKNVVRIADHVFGGSGSYRLVDASTTAAGLVVVPNAAAGTIGLTASDVGDYSLTYTVQDVITQAEQTAIIRVSVPTEKPLTMAPITTFVRANEDTTVDVLSAVQNTSGRVLLVSSAVTGDSSLSVSVVGQSAVRVSGGTADGLPGKIGTATITVTDGAGGLVEGTLTVFLAPPSTGVGAVAVPDAATVRVGGQVDIPVTANDVSPRGERLLVYPKVDGSGASGELAFVSGDVVRYVAPAKEGVYTLHYQVYLGNEPTRLDRTTITVTVTGDGANRPPQPPILEARVLSGQTISIPVDGYGMDPDGDAVVLSGVKQPKAGQGVASISADGTAIVYTATGNGLSGSQVSFGYTARDSQGASADGVVRVGVLNADLTDSAPVTYSDYVRAQKGSSTPVTVLPMLNDSDPADGVLSLVSLVPNTPAVDTNPEYARLESLIVSEKTPADGIIKLNAGDVLGTHSYVYTVQSSVSFSTWTGLIVVTVSDAGSLDYPEISDTVISVKNRNQLAAGIDVVSGKVQWPTGDTSKLELKLWGSATSGYSVKGHSIAGTLPKKGAVIPFSLTGKDAAGNPVTSYGFLRIPAFDDMRLQLNPTMRPISVGEEKSVEFNLLDVLDIDSSDVVSVRDDPSFVVQRANSTCESTGSTKATYTAGREAPWTDYCAIPVRLQGQTQWTVLAVPISIAPKDPLAQLNAMTRTIAPGSSDTVQFYDQLTSWQGGRVGDKSILDYAYTFSGSSFIVTKTDTGIAIDARADAKPGTRENIQVSVTSYGGLSATITLVVGIAAPDTPRGATFTQQCVVSAAPTCLITVIGQAGEYDPFAGKVGSGLTLVSVGSGGPVVCSVATIAVAGDTKISATYPAGPKPAGGSCIVAYTVKDAQGRTGMGQLTIDVQGYPAKPLSVTTAGYSATSVTLAVVMGEAAHPGVTSATILEGGSVVGSANCVLGAEAASASCVVSGLVNGQQHTFTARVSNAVGDSLETSAVTTSAYVSPQMSIISADPVYNNSITTQGAAAISVHLQSGDDVDHFVINGSQTVGRTGTDTAATVKVTPGPTTISVVPVSRFRPPTSGGGEGATVSTSLTAIGKPYFDPSVPTLTPGSTTVTVSGLTMKLNGGTVSNITYLAWSSGAEPTCTVNAATGDLVIGGAVYSSTTPTISGLPTQDDYWVKACGTNNFGIAVSDSRHTYVGNAQDPPAAASMTPYVISKSATGTGSQRTYAQTSGPTMPAAPSKFTLYFDGAGMSDATNWSLNPNAAAGGAIAKFCRQSWFSRVCSGPTAVPYTNAPNIAVVSFPSGACVADPFRSGGADSDVGISNAARTSAHRTVDLDPASLGLNVIYTVTWSAPYGLDPVSSDSIPICTP